MKSKKQKVDNAKLEAVKLRDNELKGKIEMIEKEIADFQKMIVEIRNTKVSKLKEKQMLKNYIILISKSIEVERRKTLKSDVDFYNTYLANVFLETHYRTIRGRTTKKEVPKLVSKFDLEIGVNRKKYNDRIKEFKAEINEKIEKLKNDKLIAENNLATVNLQIKDIEPSIREIEGYIEKAYKRILKLEEYRFVAQDEPEQNEKNSLKNKGKGIRRTGSMKIGDLENVNFESFRLNGQLGEFLGDLERYRFACALTGDGGAGKTTFTVPIVKLFLDNGMKVKTYLLETGVTKYYKELALKTGCHEMEITGEGVLKDVRKDAKIFDVIIVDSFSKLKCKAADFDKLRNDFPDTIFIMIFQKTNTGSMRGGASIFFDCTMNIDVQKRDGDRIAVMNKSRYGTQGFEYSITEERVIKTNL